MSWSGARQAGWTLGSGLVLVFGVTGWSTAISPDEPGRISAWRQPAGAAAALPRDVGGLTMPGVAAAAAPEARHEAQHAPVEARGQAPVRPGTGLAVTSAAASPTDEGAPEVEVRVGDHGDFERVVFEWPSPVEYEVVRRADQVAVAFDRPGRIDFAPVRHRFAQRVLDARTEAAPATRRVVLRVAPDAIIRSFTLEDDRIVVIDVSGGALSQPVARSLPEPERDSVQELRRALEQRDAVIENLLVRMEQLERKLALSSGELDTVVAGGAGTAGAGGGSPARAAEQPPPTAQQSLPQSAATPGQQAPAAGQSQGGEPASNSQRAPGEFDVDEEDIDRALERTLVQAGVLLLPVGQAEIEPSFSYTRREGNVPVLFTEDGATFIAQQDVRRNEFESGQILRVGLPFDSQVEFGLPYRYVDQSAVTQVGGQPRQEVDGSGQGMGDISIGVAKTLLRENGGWWPDLVARFTWDTNTGQTSDNDVLLGGGFHELRSSLSAVKRQDPLAFVGAVSYETTLEDDNVKPGDELGFNIGTVLAASPETSLRLALGQRFINNSRVDGEGINGSDRVVGTATFGASVVLGRGVLLDVAADIGLTDDAPDYAARAALPIRFNLPVY